MGGITGVVGFQGTIGALDDKTFSIGSNNHEIDALALDARTVNSLFLYLSLKDTDLTSAEKAALRLHVCNRTTVDFSGLVTQNASQHTYTVAYAAAWTSGSTLTVYLSLPPNNAATGAPEISGTVAVGHTADGGQGDHRRCRRRADDLHLPVAPGGRGERDGHYRRDREQLHGDRRRHRQDAQGQAGLHGQFERRGGPHQRPRPPRWRSRPRSRSRRSIRTC